MPINGITEFQQGLRANFAACDRQFEARVDEIALEATKLGELAMHETIDNTPSSLSPGKDNRNWTHHMNQSLDSKVTQRGRKRGLTAGWLKDQQEYFLVQEYGGTVNGITVTPMDALMHGFTAMTQYIEQQMSALERKGR
ncbi:MAG: hypothetical protein ACTHJ9_04445 [Rhodanobacter sp.]